MSQLTLPFESDPTSTELTLEQQAAKIYLQLLAHKLKGKIVPGYYSIDGKRYRITLCLDNKSRWYRWTFLRTGSDYHDSKLLAKLDPDKRPSGSEHGVNVLLAIMENPIKAMQDYASITGICGVCGRKLEDPTSVAIGIGPVCLANLESW